MDHYSIDIAFAPQGDMVSLKLKLRWLLSSSFFFQELSGLFRGEGCSMPGKYGESILNIKWQWETLEEKNFHHKVFSSREIFEVGHWTVHTTFLLCCFFFKLIIWTCWSFRCLLGDYKHTEIQKESSWDAIFTLIIFLDFILMPHQLEFLIQTILKCYSNFT